MISEKSNIVVEPPSIVKVRVFAQEPYEKPLMYCDFSLDLRKYESKREADLDVQAELSKRVNSIEEFDNGVVVLKWYFEGMEDEVSYISMIDLRVQAS